MSYLWQSTVLSISQALSRLELNALMSVTEGREEEVDDKVFDWLVSTFESTDTGLTLQGYKQAQYFMLQKCNYKEEVLFSDFKLLVLHPMINGFYICWLLGIQQRLKAYAKQRSHSGVPQVFKTYSSPDYTAILVMNLL